MNLEVGDIIAVHTGGVFARIIQAAQFLSGWADWRYNHAGVVSRITGGEVFVVEAAPTGVREVPMRYKDWRAIPFDFTPTQQTQVRNALLARLGTPYGFVDIGALALLTLGWRPRWVETVCRRTNTVVCSQLAALAVEAGGVKRYGDWFWVIPAQLFD